MSFMELTQVLGNLGELIGAVAVLATLIYLATQIRHSTDQMQLNTRAVEVAAYQDLIGRITTFNQLSLTDEAWADLLFRARTKPGSLTELEQARYNTYLTSLTRHADMAYFQYERGLLTHARFRSSLGPFHGALRQSNLARKHCTGTLTNEIFDPGFRQELAVLLAEIEADGSPRPMTTPHI